MNVLLTGSTGFLGRVVLKKLLERGDVVYALARRSSILQPGYHHIQGDLGISDGLTNVPWNKIDLVMHLAAAGVKASRRVWAETVRTNVIGTQLLLNAIDRHAPHHPVVMLTRTFYEDALSTAPTLQDNPYVVTKAAGSFLFREWMKTYAGRVAEARVFQVFGSGDDENSVLSYAAKNLLAGTPCIFGSGCGERDWIYVQDAADALMHGASAAKLGGFEFDVGSGALFTIRSAVEQLAVLAGDRVNLLTFDPSRDRSDVDLAIRADRLPAGWTPRFTLTEGLQQLLLTS